MNLTSRIEKKIVNLSSFAQPSVMRDAPQNVCGYVEE